MSDRVEQPEHYTSHPAGVQMTDIAEHFGFCLGNVIKYVWRANLKGEPIEDLRKAQWYLEREIARREAGNTIDLDDATMVRDRDGDLWERRDNGRWYGAQGSGATGLDRSCVGALSVSYGPLTVIA